VLDVDGAIARARELISFADGLDDAGYHETARRSRIVARDCLEIADAFISTHHAFLTAKARHAFCLDLIVERGYAESLEAIEAGRG